MPLDLYRRTIIAAGQNGLTENMLAPLRPWFAAITLTQAALERTDFRSALGVDQHFAKQAGDSGKPIIGFETLLEQLGYLASVGDNQTLMLESTLDELPELERGFREVMKAWEEGTRRPSSTCSNRKWRRQAAGLAGADPAGGAQPQLAEEMVHPAKRELHRGRGAASLRRPGLARVAGAAGLAHHPTHRAGSAQAGPPVGRRRGHIGPVRVFMWEGAHRSDCRFNNHKRT